MEKRTGAKARALTNVIARFSSIDMLCGSTIAIASHRLELGIEYFRITTFVLLKDREKGDRCIRYQSEPKVVCGGMTEDLLEGAISAFEQLAMRTAATDPRTISVLIPKVLIYDLEESKQPNEPEAA